jgi:hypothetical protein
MERWNRLGFHHKPTNTILLIDETYEDQEENGRRRNNFLRPEQEIA